MIRKLLALILCAFTITCLIACSNKDIPVPTPDITQNNSNNQTDQTPTNKAPQTQEEHITMLKTLVQNTSMLPKFTVILTNDTLVKYDSHTVSFDGMMFSHLICCYTQITPGEYVTDRKETWTFNSATQEITPDASSGVVIPQNISISTVLSSFFNEDLLQIISDNSNKCTSIDTHTYSIPNITIETITGTRQMENIRITHEHGIITSIESTFGPQRLNIIFNVSIDTVEK